MTIEQLEAEIVDRARYYSQYKDLFQQFVSNDVYFTRDGDEVQLRKPSGEILIIHSASGYVRQHLSITTVEEWEEHGLVARDEDEERAVYRLTATGYHLGS